MNVTSHRLTQLAAKFGDKAYRHSYLARHLRAFLANQIRALRGDRTQAEFGDKIGKSQSAVARLEREGYGKVTLQTLIDIATKLDIGLVVRFVDYPTFLLQTTNQSISALQPPEYDQKVMDELLKSADQTGRGSLQRDEELKQGKFISQANKPFERFSNQRRGRGLVAENNKPGEFGARWAA